MGNLKVYLHSSKEEMESIAEEEFEDTMSDDAINNFKYALHEVDFDLDVNVETGNYEILKISEGNKAFYSEKHIIEAMKVAGINENQIKYTIAGLKK